MWVTVFALLWNTRKHSWGIIVLWCFYIMVKIVHGTSVCISWQACFKFCMCLIVNSWETNLRGGNHSLVFRMILLNLKTVCSFGFGELTSTKEYATGWPHFWETKCPEFFLRFSGHFQIFPWATRETKISWNIFSMGFATYYTFSLSFPGYSTKKSMFHESSLIFFKFSEFSTFSMFFRFVATLGRDLPGMYSCADKMCPIRQLSGNIWIVNFSKLLFYLLMREWPQTVHCEP